MARRDSAIALDTNWTAVFEVSTAPYSGSDGDEMKGCILCATADSNDAVDYRLDGLNGDAADPSGEFGTLQAGECVRIDGVFRRLKKISMRANASTATGSIEEVVF